MNVFPLLGVPQHYAWGGLEFIPKLLGHPTPANQPYAELWFGAHHKAPSLLRHQPQNLAELISSAPETLLGRSSVKCFGPQLPFLLKILDVRNMLSIQVHPNKTQAQQGFAEEQNQRIPSNAPHRNFKDANHKPELMVALSDFWLLHGFTQSDIIEERLKHYPSLYARWQQYPVIGQFYPHIMQLPQTEVNILLQPVVRKIQSLPQTPKKSDPEYWLGKAIRSYCREDYLDRGLVSILLMNLVGLRPGEGIFQDAGVLHAYLEGINIELMANSDNVFRGGLTPKHVDVPQLLKHVQLRSIQPNILHGVAAAAGIAVYPTPAQDFQLSVLTLDTQTPRQRTAKAGPQIGLVMEGRVIVNDQFEVDPGYAFFVPHQVEIMLDAQVPSRIMLAGLPPKKNQAAPEDFTEGYS